MGGLTEQGRERRYCLFGAAPDTHNLGVSALMESTVSGIRGVHPDAALTVFDYGLGGRELDLTIGIERHAVRSLGTRLTRRLHRPESLRTMRVSVALGRRSNPVVRRLLDADRVLDISGGDSFTDLYGRSVFREIALHKQVVLSLGRPLVLLPQTYGPFAGRRAEREAASIVRRAEQAWARDERSFEVLAQLLGDDLDVARHRVGVDVAFALPATPIDESGPFAPILPAIIDDAPTVGVNVSGMLWFDPTDGKRFGMTIDHRELMVRFVERLVADGARVVLVPHVVAPEGHPQSDHAAAVELAAELSATERRRVVVAGRPRSASEAKGLISRFDWFTGARMHATIAALSSGVPVAGLAYSPKMAGVFERCGRGDHVVDARSSTTGTALDDLWSSYVRRDDDRSELAAAVEPVVVEAREQFAVMLGVSTGAQVVR